MIFQLQDSSFQRVTLNPSTAVALNVKLGLYRTASEEFTVLMLQTIVEIEGEKKQNKKKTGCFVVAVKSMPHVIICLLFDTIFLFLSSEKRKNAPDGE